jgi:hypothetical protein
MAQFGYVGLLTSGKSVGGTEMSSSPTHIVYNTIFSESWMAKRALIIKSVDLIFFYLDDQGSLKVPFHLWEIPLYISPKEFIETTITYVLYDDLVTIVNDENMDTECLEFMLDKLNTTETYSDEQFWNDLYYVLKTNLTVLQDDGFFSGKFRDIIRVQFNNIPSKYQLYHIVTIVESDGNGEGEQDVYLQKVIPEQSPFIFLQTEYSLENLIELHANLIAVCRLFRIDLSLSEKTIINQYVHNISDLHHYIFNTFVTKLQKYSDRNTYNKQILERILNDIKFQGRLMEPLYQIEHELNYDHFSNSLRVSLHKHLKYNNTPAKYNKKSVNFQESDLEYKNNDTDCIRIQYTKNTPPFSIYLQSTYNKERIPSRNNKDRLVYLTYDYHNNRYCGSTEPDSTQKVLDHIEYLESQYDKFDSDTIKKETNYINMYKNLFLQRL